MAKEKLDLTSLISEYNTMNEKDEYIKTNIPLLDMFVGGKNNICEEMGFLKGKLYSLSGPNGIGKSTMIAEISKRFAKNGNKVIIIDFEVGFNENSIESFGISEFVAYKNEDIPKFIDGDKNILIINPVTFNNTAKILNEIIEVSNVKVDAVFFDSLKTMQATYRVENIDTIEQGPVGLHARSQEAFLPFVKVLFSKYKIVGLFINQMRNKSIGPAGFIEDEPTNNAFLYNMDVRMIVKSARSKTLPDIVTKIETNFGEKVDKKIGNWVTINITKGRAGNSHSSIVLPIIFGRGISTIYLYTQLLITNNIISPGPRSDSKCKMEKFAEAISTVTDTFEIPEYATGGMNGIYAIVKSNLDAVEKYIIENNMLFVEKQKNED